jgi:nucleoid-associated protein YgaU
MRNDLKIGMLVVAAIVVIVVVYFVITSGGDDPNNMVEETPSPTFIMSNNTEDTGPGTDVVEVAIVAGGGADDTDPFLDLDGLEPLTDDGTTGVVGISPVTGVDPIVDDRTNVIVLIDDGPVTDDRTTVDPVTSVASIYTVTTDDTTGFWGIAEKNYGSGKYWPLIRDANPNANTRALRAGQKLNIPPLPVQQTTVTAPAGPALSAGTTSDERTYTVQADDSAGYWGISKKVYNNQGKYYLLIQRANPGVDPLKLNAGDTLVIPALPTEQPASTTTGTLPAVPTGAGTYTVTDDDTTGFWGIAEKQYGHGKFYYLIEQANRDVDTANLRAGQVLVIPPKPAVDSTDDSSSSTPSTPSTPVTGRPVFE